jgi:hypothetical protein
LLFSTPRRSEFSASAGELAASVENIVELVRETAELCAGLYQPRYESEGLPRTVSP